MPFEHTLAGLAEAISAEIASVYHLSSEDALKALKKSAFYQLLSDEDRGLWQDGVIVNFRRYQNEVEYGAWNRNEFGGIVE